MDSGLLGKSFGHGELIVREGDTGDKMYVIQQGEVEFVKKHEGQEVTLGVGRKGDFFGEMALFGPQVQGASVRARGDVQVLTVDKRNLLRRIQADPSLAYRIIETLSHRNRELWDGVTFLSGTKDIPGTKL